MAEDGVSERNNACLVRAGWDEESRQKLHVPDIDVRRMDKLVVIIEDRGVRGKNTYSAICSGWF